ncbi:MAG TPA: (Fe-S)-binding protein [Bacteroidales bacterium]|nr:(Fe-S)-binding protein [Bacteroidales bacterium]
MNTNLPIMSDLQAAGKHPEYLYWVGCAGAFDDRYQKVARAFARILNHLEIDYAVLGKEETCNGDPARRAGNEMLFHMQASMVVETLTRYEVKKIVTTCPHCFNIFKNEYPDVGWSGEVVHHTQFLQQMIDNGKLKVPVEVFKNQKVVFHDPCYLGRGNDEYEAPRKVIDALETQRVEMSRAKSFALCCGAGGAQMFKEAEPGNKEVYAERTEEALATGARVIATACPFCMTMLTDGIKYQNKEEEVENLDVAEMIATSLGL